MIDQLRGATNFRLGEWQGYDGVDFEAVVNLGSLQKVNRIATGFLQDAGAWIWMPLSVEYLVSTDGKNFTPLTTLANPIAENEMQSIIRDFEYKTDIETRYIKVKANKQGPIPDWHTSAGNKRWIFVDEIDIK